MKMSSCSGLFSECRTATTGTANTAGLLAALRLLTLALAAALTLFVTPALGDEGVDFDAVLETLKSDRGKLEKMDAAVSILKKFHAAETCSDFRAAIDAFQIYGSDRDAVAKISRVFDSAFAAIDAAEGDHARTAAKLAFDLTKGSGRSSTNPWYFEAGFRVIYANLCN